MQNYPMKKGNPNPHHYTYTQYLRRIDPFSFAYRFISIHHHNIQYHIRLESSNSLIALMSSYISKFHKFCICKFSETSIDRKKNVHRSISISAEVQEGTKSDNAPSIEKQRTERSRGHKSRKLAISLLADCGGQSKQGIVLDRIPEESQMPEWISTGSFDEMLKLSSSSSSSTSNDRKEIHYNFKSSIEKSSLEFQISSLKFNDLVHKLQKTEQISITVVHSGDTDQKSDEKLQRATQVLPALPKLSFMNSRKESHTTCANTLVQCNDEKRLISKWKDKMTDSLLIMKSSSDPQKEFKESMMEMIVENKIKYGEGMEELLGWFLYLNSEDYHEVIIKVFKQIWNELNQV